MKKFYGKDKIKHYFVFSWTNPPSIFRSSNYLGTVGSFSLCIDSSESII